ncbi:uncharacterized protein LOC118271320 [Spodoptera frugiperda]|uniref:SFRICE_041738 n=1 Tax=Spodoptera frugiperda TaxID=7108 RepID=A0A2H1V2A2_SPOFR|nr:uncharacterized protein LOC118271320 [Spodoptera frugiperda]XP_050551773.1 uncharacterized protein LOC118271320 [Spodoptera frugiperda]
MIIFIFLLAVTAAADVNETEPPCPSCLLMNTTCYNMSYLFDLDAPFRKQVVINKMDLLRSKNMLYFSFEPVFEDEEYYKTGFVKLEDLSYHGIITGSQILNLGTFDIDQANGQIYFGGSDGIFVLDTNNNQMASYSSRGDTITNVFYKNQVYFVRYDDKGIIVKQGDYFKTILEYWTVKKFVVVEKDTVNVIVFLSNLGLFVSKGKVVHRLSKNAFFRGLAVDLDGEVYAWWLDGIYKVIFSKNIIHSKIEKVTNLPLIGAMAFDNNNNILIASDKSLYLMAKTSHSCGVVKPAD